MVDAPASSQPTVPVVCGTSPCRSRVANASKSRRIDADVFLTLVTMSNSSYGRALSADVNMDQEVMLTLGIIWAVMSTLAFRAELAEIDRPYKST